MGLTRISDFGNWTAKREDEASASGPDYPSGSKVRQYAKMAAASPGLPMLVGCSAHSAMQIYIAAAAKQARVPGIIYTAARALRTEATRYALEFGAEVIEVRPAYLNVCRSRARKRGLELGAYVHWDAKGALLDAKEQCANIPRNAGRVVVPTGSGLTCSGILAGLAENEHLIPVLAVAVSDMAQRDEIIAGARKLTDKVLPELSLVRSESPYDKWTAAALPDGTPLDPYYSAKALRYIKARDCLWLPGLRPFSAMPTACVEQIKRLQDHAPQA